jgi:hypothetical protein
MNTVDPYYEWLGIQPKDQPPNHYRLLGLELFEENRSVIDTAANRQMSFIKQYQTGPDSELTQKLLNELSAARLCLLSAPAKAAYDEKLRAKFEAQAAPAPAVPISSNIHWRNESAPPQSPPVERVSPSPLVNAILLPRSKAGPGALAAATGFMVAALALVLGFVLASSPSPEPTSPADTVAQGPQELPEKPDGLVAKPVTASEPPTFSPPSEPDREPARMAEPVDSQLAPPTMAVPTTPKATQVVPPLGPVIVVESAEPVPASMNQPDLSPVIGPSAELPTTTAPLPPPPVETLEQADKRLQAAAEQASSSAEHQAVGQELLSLADKAILDSEIELAKRIVERALAAARKSESDALVKQATLVWSELEQPLTDEVKEEASQRLRERDISPSAASQEKGQKD